MKIRDIMTTDPACCLRETTAREAAGLMREFDCGAIPVVESMERRKLLGIVTDRDLAVRGIAEGKGPETPVGELLTESPAAADPDDEIETVREVMIREKVRRVPVTGRDGILTGIVAQADLAREDAAASDREVGRIVEAISEPNPTD
ncbi:MAG TPA: CBS domain-containing protein [Gemmatimonadales bacterium]|nr:CBS domain-containing protein [Gemmatimonadales bacterium]